MSEQLEGNLKITNYIDAESIQFYKSKLSKPLAHEFQLWELIPDELRQYLTACAILSAVQIMVKEIQDQLLQVKQVQKTCLPETPGQSDTGMV